MRQALRIFRKDVRHLWPHAAVVVFLAAVYACMDAALPGNPMMEGAEAACGLLLWVAACILAIAAVHEDPLTGDRQFWITRPYSWKSLLLAKALFILVFVSLPALLDQVEIGSTQCRGRGEN